MEAPTPTQRPSLPRGALVVAAILADFAWVGVHVRALEAIGLTDGDPGFYAAYQALRGGIAGAALVVALRSGFFSRRELGLDRKHHGPALRWLGKVMGGALLALAAALSLAWLVAPDRVCDVAARTLGGPPIYPWWMFVRDVLCMVMLAPIYEEIVYRALLISSLRERLSDPQALVIAGGVFVVLHAVYGYGWNTGYLLVAVALGWVYLRTGSIIAAMVLHAANNLWYAIASYGRYELGDDVILGWFCAR